MSKSSSILALGFVAALTLGLLGCGPGQIDKADVEASAQQALTESVGQESPPISCPSDLEAEVGASEVCTITISDQPYDVTVTVTSVENGKAKFSAEVATEPRTE